MRPIISAAAEVLTARETQMPPRGHSAEILAAMFTTSPYAFLYDHTHVKPMRKRIV